MLRGANIEEMGIFYKFMANNLNGVGRKKEKEALNELAEKEGWINLKCTMQEEEQISCLVVFPVHGPGRAFNVNHMVAVGFNSGLGN